MAIDDNEDDDQISADQQKAGTLIWPHQEPSLHHPEFTPYAPLADKANFVLAEWNTNGIEINHTCNYWHKKFQQKSKLSGANLYDTLFLED